MSDLETLKRSRAAKLGWLTRASENLDALVLKSTTEGADAVDKLELEDAVAEFDKRLSAVDDCQASLELHLASEEDIFKEVNQAADRRERAKKSRLAASKLLITLTPPLADTLRSVSPTPSSGSNGSGSSRTSAPNVKLPRLELPKFSGDVIQWQSFWDQFNATVDNTSLPDVTKFTYLRSLLEGDAKKAIDGLSLTSQHYATARKLLESRYGRKELIIFTHIQGLLALSCCSKGTKVDGLKRLQDSLLTHTRSLEALGITGAEYGIFLTPLILSRLPSEIRLEWTRDCEGKEGDLTHLLEFLRCEIERRDKCESFKVSASSESRTAASGERRRSSSPHKVPTGSALHSASLPGCGFCHKGHPTWKCWDVLKLPITEREKCIKKAGLCFVCLKRGHVASKCVGQCFKCKGKHNAMCCQTKDQNCKSGEDVQVVKEPIAKEPVVKQPEVEATVTTPALRVNVCNQSKCTVLPTAQVYVHGEKGIVKATLLFDSGSDRTYISKSLAKRAGTKWCSSQEVRYAAFGGGKSSNSQRNVYQFHVSGANVTNSSPMLIEAVEVPVICSPLSRPKIPKDVLGKFGDLELADSYEYESELSIDILVGLDYFWQLLKPGRVQLAEGPVAMESSFGWVISGTCNRVGVVREHVSCQMLILQDIPDSTFKQFWELESLGISNQTVKEFEVDPVLAKFNESTKFDDSSGRYEVSLPWKVGADTPVLVDNFESAKVRLSCLSRKLNRDPELRDGYNRALSEMECNHVIEEVPASELDVPYPVYYLPHRPVVRECSSSTKIRPVFDASARGPNNVSLNDCLEAGPSLVPNLVEVLLRFRRWQVALCADITKAFLQIKLRREDQDVHRFLWLDDDRIRVMRFLRVTFGVKSSPFLLNATVKHHLKGFPNTNIVQELRENLYVDDFLSGADTESEAHQMYSEAKDIMQKASMSLTKWNSNNPFVAEQVRCPSRELIGETEGLKILGVKWLPSEDCFTFEGISLPDDVVPTKRVVLSFLARLYDPLGFITPFIVFAKCLFQELWQLGVKWDEDVPTEISMSFVKWLAGIKLLKQLRIPRCLSAVPWSSIKGLQLHVFGDASEKAYGAVLYCRVPLSDSLYHTVLLYSKAKVAPLKRVTLPRLELLGALIAARILAFVIKALKLVDGEFDYRCWTDSTIALSWIKGSPDRWKQFVGNRTREIQQLTDPSKWNHCPGVENPADLTTRGLSAATLVDSELWFKGPDWLRGPCDLFPTRDSVSDLPDSDSVVCEKLVLQVVSKCRETYFSDFIQRFSSFGKLLRVFAWVRRFIHNARHSTSKCLDPDLSYSELSEAKIMIFKVVQAETFPDELHALKKGENISRKSSLLKLDPFLGEDGLVRVKGRLQLSDLSYESKHPIILPKSHLSYLMVLFQHKFMKHASVNSIVSSLRAAYWILGVRRLVKQVKRDCLSCQRQDAKPCNQVVAPLPAFRVSEAPPFSVTGVDFAGPLFCVDSKHKYYICLFTCAVIRAVHLELTDSQSLSDFMLALRRFAARRGLPSIIYSDNAATFNGAKAQIQAYFGHLAPMWKNIVPLSPWWGGWWERLVRSVKTSLRRTVGNRCLTRSELETSLHEVEAYVNSRPITFTSDEIDCCNPLTPNHFLIGRVAGFDSPVIEDPESVIAGALVEREIRRQQLMDKFWSIWRSEYLSSLPHAIKRFNSQGNLKVGSVVLVREDNVPRMLWSMGVVQKLYYSKDGVIRSADVKTSKGLRTRAIQRLHDLELNPNSPVSLDAKDIGAVSPNVSPEQDSSLKRSRKVPKRLEDFVLY